MVVSDELELRLWAAREHEPRAAIALPPGGLALTRDVLGGSDRRISRGANAVRVERTGQVTVRVRVPAGAMVRPFVLADTTLAALQNDVPPSTRQWRVSPGQLGEPWTMATADGVALALLRAAVWNEKSEVMHLVRLPPPAAVEPGSESSFALPITIALGGAALEITSLETSAPPESPPLCVASFDVAPLRRAMLVPGRRPVRAPADDRIWIPGFDHALERPAAERAVAERGPAGARWFLLPALREHGGELLLLAMRDAQGRWRLLGRAGDPAAWIAELAGDAPNTPRAVPARAAPDRAELAGGAPSAPRALPVRAAPDRAPPPSRVALATPERFGDFVTYDAATAEVVQQLRSAAPSALSVLLLGESGTGKEILAAALHERSGRKGAFVPVSSAAIPESLMESELFGHVGGAYTGARGDRPGAFVAARGGTLFLDEIGDAPVYVQLGLLRALETRKVKPVGSDREVEVDVRVVAATSRDLDAELAAERFRFDLYHRLAQLAVRIPPLRERPADIDWLAEDLLHATAPARWLTAGARAALAAHPWPGNVRELRNTIERAVALSGTEGALDAPDLLLHSNTPTGASSSPSSPSSPAPAPAPALCASPIAFPAGVVELARRALGEGSMPKPEDLAPKRARSHQRAAFLYLRTEQSGPPWPPALMRQYQRLFGQLWATSEGGRGLTELMLVLGLYPSDPADRAALSALLERAGVAGGVR